MATSTCVKCGSTAFEAAEVQPAGGSYKLVFIQCSQCGGVLGVQDYVHTKAMFVEQNRAIMKIAQVVGVNVNL